MFTPLHHSWTVKAVAGPVPSEFAHRPIPATVPGVATTDLLAAGLIPDPYLDRNEEALAWIGRCDWQYDTHFDLEALRTGERLDLVCAGLDTVATLQLNGVAVATTANMHRQYRFDIGALAQPGRNHLRVTFEAPVDAARRRSEELGPRPHTNTHPFNAIRKMACAYEWDWGPDLATSGIWRPIGLDRWHTARLASVRALARVEGPRGDRPSAAAGTVAFHVEVERAPGAEGPLSLSCGAADQTVTVTLAARETSAVVEVRVPEVGLWWPVGYGDQPLYDVSATLAAVGDDLDRWAARAGFKTVSLDATPDEIGTALTLTVNGTPITVRGVNWIPDDCFPHRVDRARYEVRLRQAVEANVNLVRVWGGGLYELDEFYETCDELGLLVWQDFLFACAAYAEEEPLRSEVLAEAWQAVIRLSNHASLALWNGCNENIWGYEDWGWKEPLAGATWGAGYYYELLPAIVAELDPGRPYSAGTPWSFGAEAHPNDPRHGTMHAWDVWNRLDYAAYADYHPRFVAEFGFQGPPAWSTLSRAIHDAPPSPAGSVLSLHQKATDGMAKLANGLAPHLPEPVDLDSWHWAMSLNQARAVAFGIEHWRALDPPCTGTIVWQLNDCWPVISWAAVDGDGRRKPLWYALRRAFADRLLTVVAGPEGEPVLVAVNDGAEPWSASIELARQSFAGKELATESIILEVPAGGRTSLPVPLELARPADRAAEVLVATARDQRAFWWWEEDKDLALPAPALEAEATPVPGGWDVIVTAPTLHKDVSLLADKAHPEAVVDQMLTTVLAGETVTFHVAAGTLDPADLVSPYTLRSANQLVRGD